MILLPLEIGPVTRVARAMRAADAAEIYATRWSDDPAALARDAVACSRFGAVAALDRAGTGSGDAVLPVAALGAAEAWPGLWSVWMFATDDWPLVAAGLTRWVRRQLAPALRAAGGRRAECRSHVDHHAAHRWLERLGARREAVHPAYGKHGETFVTYAWVAEAPGGR